MNEIKDSRFGSRRNNKKGIVLAFVIVIGAALFILAAMAAVAANNSIGVSDTGIKSREAYLSAKSGIEYAKTKVNSTTAAALVTLSNEVDLITLDPTYVISLSDATHYGYGNLDTGFAMPMNGSVTSSSPLYTEASIKISYSVEHNLTTSPAITGTPGAVSYQDQITISVTSIGNSQTPSTLFGFLEKGITLTYEIQAIVSLNGLVNDPNVIPNTDGIPVLDEWPTKPKNPHTNGDTLHGGATFVYNGDYYINLYNAWVIIGSDPSEYPNMILITPGTALNIDDWVGVGPYQSKTLAEFNTFYGVNMQRGDKVVHNGIYYIFRDDPDTVSWVPIPPGYLWVKIPGQ